MAQANVLGFVQRANEFTGLPSLTGSGNAL